MKFAFIILGPFKDDQAVIKNGVARIVGVRDVAEACNVAKKLVVEGIQCIELCGAFGAEGARQIIAATNNKVAVGYVVHLPEQDEYYKQLFDDK